MNLIWPNAHDWTIDAMHSLYLPGEAAPITGCDQQIKVGLVPSTCSCKHGPREAYERMEIEIVHNAQRIIKDQADPRKNYERSHTGQRQSGMKILRCSFLVKTMLKQSSTPVAPREGDPAMSFWKDAIPFA